VADRDAPLRAVAEEGLEARHVVRRADQEDVADAGEHQRAERVVHHRLVVHRQQLLAERKRRRVQASAGAAGEDDALARLPGHAASLRSRNSVSMRSTPCCQGGRTTSKAVRSLVVSSLEFFGRGAACGYAEVGIGAIASGATRSTSPRARANSTTCFA